MLFFTKRVLKSWLADFILQWMSLRVSFRQGCSHVRLQRTLVKRICTSICISMTSVCICLCVCICEAWPSHNVSQHYLTFSFDKRLPPRQYRFTMSILATGLLAWNRGGGGGKSPQDWRPDPCSLPSPVCTEGPIPILSCCQSKATDGKCGERCGCH